MLDPASSAVRARPLHHWSRARQASVRSHFEDIHRAWCDDWLPADDAPGHRDVTVWLSDSEPESALVPEGRAIFWSFADASVVRPRFTAIDAIARAMFGADAAREAPSMAGGVARAAWEDWLQRMRALPASEAIEMREVSPATGGKASKPWSGTLWLRWWWCGGFWRLALPHEVVAAWGGEEPSDSAEAVSPTLPTTGLEEALARERITLRTVLGGTELNLGQLQLLSVGDVIPLEHRLDTPLKVVSTEGVELCEGWLGQRQGRIAVEMTRSADGSSTPPLLKEKKP